MRTITFGVGNSLDNFIARSDHGHDWLVWDKEVAAISARYWKTIDAVLMGRKTYETVVKSGTTSYPRVKNYVFSRRWHESPDKRVEIVTGEAVEFVRRLKGLEGKGICVMGGGELARSLFEADLIDELGVNIHPILLGSGVPLFLSLKRQIDLERMECKPLKNGSVFIRYRVRHVPDQSAPVRGPAPRRGTARRAHTRAV